VTGLISNSAHWEILRATGVVAFVLLTVTVGLGIANLTRWQRGRWSRTVVALVHRNASLLAVVFVAVHVVTAVTDKFVTIPIAAVVVPGLSHYRPFWVGLGAVTLDLLVTVTVTSLLRARLGHRAWRAVHWLAYASWPVAVAHAIGSGTDTGRAWTTVIYATAGAAVLAALAVRLRWHPGPDAPLERPTAGPTPARPRTLPAPASALAPAGATTAPTGARARVLGGRSQ
jgi:sulfoxide reductase heme-binding subunit YedZ